MSKKAIAVMVLVLVSVGMAQDEEKVSVPKSMLTEQQRAQLKLDDKENSVHAYVGIGKEIGEAVNGSLMAISTQSNEFAKTPVGKLTAFIVIWKVIGDQATHILFGVLLLVVFLPIWIWSYRRTCMARRFKTGKDQWQVVEYQGKFDMEKGQFGPRFVHLGAIILLIGTAISTVFSY